MSLPAFKYHPDPVATGAIVESSETCACCGKARGFIYEAAVYGEKDVGGALCPWCIADGAAAKKYGVTFSDDEPLLDAGLPEGIVEEVTQKTPGYIAWQQETWHVCCDDSCAYHGDAPKEELQALKGDELAGVLDFLEWDSASWSNFLATYEPGGGHTLHKFVCLHCGETSYESDMN
jgi:uncharacterized protein